MQPRKCMELAPYIFCKLSRVWSVKQPSSYLDSLQMNWQQAVLSAIRGAIVTSSYNKVPPHTQATNIKWRRVSPLFNCTTSDSNNAATQQPPSDDLKMSQAPDRPQRHSRNTAALDLHDVKACIPTLVTYASSSLLCSVALHHIWKCLFIYLALHPGVSGHCCLGCHVLMPPIQLTLLRVCLCVDDRLSGQSS